MKYNILQLTKDLVRIVRTLDTRMDSVQQAIGRIESRMNLGGFVVPSVQLHRFEFKVYSQWGEDGIIEYLIQRIPCPQRIFVEFGVGDYTECNTRFLLESKNWSGLVIDGDQRAMRKLQRDPILARRDLRFKCAHVTRENINGLLAQEGIQGDIGLISVDIDGNDYWVWEAITVVRPTIVVIEYNHRFGPDRAVTIPYRTDFNRFRAHFSGVYFGASLRALTSLAERKGYSLVGCTSTGVNAFFVREEERPSDLAKVDAREAYVPGRFREGRDKKGRLTYLTSEEEDRILADLPLVNV